MSSSLPPRLHDLVKHLPFAHDDFDAANSAFQTWLDDETEEARQIVDLWMYVYVALYFHRKYAAGDFESPSDYEETFGRAFEKARAKIDTIRHPDRFASWVSVVCKNTFLNAMRRVPEQSSIEGDNLSLVDEEPPPSPDSAFVTHLFERAIDRLSPYLQDVARLFLLEDKSYHQISEATGKSVATIRVYKQRALKQLREDPDIRDLNDSFP